MQDISDMTSTVESERRKILTKLGKRPVGELSTLPEEHEEVAKKTQQEEIGLVEGRLEEDVNLLDVVPIIEVAHMVEESTHTQDITQQSVEVLVSMAELEVQAPMVETSTMQSAPMQEELSVVQ